jgi:hypothetical protein
VKGKPPPAADASPFKIIGTGVHDRLEPPFKFIGIRSKRLETAENYVKHIKTHTSHMPSSAAR